VAAIATGLLISDFNVDNLAAYLRNDRNDPAVDAVAAPYGQVGQALLNSNLACWREHHKFVVIWTRPEAVIEEFGIKLQFADTDVKRLLEQVDDYAARIVSIKDRASVIFVPTWVLPTFHQGHGMLDLAPAIGNSRILLQMNLRLMEALERASNIVPLNTSKWVELVGEKAFNARLWYMAKVPFSNDVFKAAVRDIKAGLRGLAGQSRKLVVVDLDDTLWAASLGIKVGKI
jgi:predicted enzyme involved in methoxymalonyl-ACP biosynthesis